MNKEELIPYIEKICRSPQFIKSPTNQALLKFLTNCTLSETVPKEYTIAKEVFGKDANDSFNVRVYISNLRKKLSDYYKNKGKDDKIIFQIPQGNYSVEFIEKATLTGQHPVANIKKIFNNKWFFLISGIILTLFSLNLFQSKKSQQNALNKTVTWNGFFENGKPCNIVLGDHYFFTGQLLDSVLFYMRLPSINSDFELDEFTQEHPHYKDMLNKDERTYLSPQSSNCLHTILPVFIRNKIETKLKLSSNLNWEDLPNHNFLFMGSYRATRIFREYINKAGLYFDTKTAILDFTSSDSTFSYQHGGNYLTNDYVAVLRIEAENGSNILFFLSSYEIGNDAVTKFFIDKEQLKTFEKQLPKEKPKCYKALFKVSGSYLTAFETELLHIYPIENKELLKWP